ncbi:ATP-binding cassette domain-containing protein [Wenzhouxiangella sp. AB-CW3]|uniref:ABC transporter ATP-binding protein n=1 Tax=Wenzhouxiangella sp. AB-CW3 TaxID=2771012 RepID=UPI00168BD41F|nr:ATP-binding cassette domain-containing protein [Wenzhouxiangella sp. AB-CW3]QOC23225.1 ATP-binding cassette domain-containing protein [Wenzhouxiangella sp. AB-CW3]
MIRFHDVCKQFATVQAVDALSFAIEPGEIFALLGPNGAGKTTSVRMIMQLMVPDSGRIEYHPELRENDQVERSQLGYLPEERGLYQDATVLKSLLYLAALRGCPADQARARALEWLERTDLADRAEEKVSALSKGNQQKVQFIAAVLHRPRFAVLDEPFSGLDPINQERMCAWIRELRDQGTTLLLSAHQLQLIERIADRILLIDHGRERVSGTLSEIRAATVSSRKLVVEYGAEVDPETLEDTPGISACHRNESGQWEVFLDPDAQLNDALQGLCQAGEVTHLATATPSLHEIFVESFDRQENRG